jgi:hypothetical protein
MAHFDAVRVSDRRIGYGPSTRVADLTKGAGTLGADPVVRALSDCLADPLAAVFTDRVAGGERANGPRIAIGVRGAAGKPSTEVLCVAAAAEPAARAEAERLRAVFTGGTTVSGVPWSAVLADVRVEVSDANVVAVTARPSGAVRPGVFVKALSDMSLGAAFSGGPPGRES